MKRKRRKYGNTKVELDGMTFDSKNEAARYVFLKEQQDLGVISDLRRQETYELIPRQSELVRAQLKTKTKMVAVFLERPVKYVADFEYTKDGKRVVEDVKGSRATVTPDFRIKKKLMLYMHGIRLRIINNPQEPV